MQNIFSHYIKTDNLSFKYARGVSDKSGKEFHIYYEIILFLEGDAEFISENLHIKLKSDTLIIIPKETYHQLIIHGNPENYRRCVLQFEDIEELSDLIGDSIKSVSAIFPNEEIKSLFGKLIKETKGKGKHSKIILKSVLALILNEIISNTEIKNEENTQNDLIIRAIDFINNNIEKELSITEIAKNCNVSVSTISHIFRKEMNIPLHQFIIKKRIINAYQKISQGMPATAAAIQSGFNDYSGFYRQYKKMFGFPPSERYLIY